MIQYLVDKKIDLSLKNKTISREVYKSAIKSVVQCGKLSKDPSMSVVIVAYNEGEDLIRNLEHWKKQTRKDFELILIDNGLDDLTVEKVKNFDLLYIQAKKNVGCCGGRNIGAVYANSDILVFGDADGYNSEEYLEKVSHIMQNNNFVAVRGKVVPIRTELQNEFMPTHYDKGNKKVSSLIDTEGNSIWRKKDYIRVGGFEDSLAGGEGLVLQYRMVEFYDYDKNSFVYDPSLILYHDYHQNNKKLKYKIRQNITLNKQLNNKYPFMKVFISNYLEKGDFRNVTNKKEHSNMVKQDIKKIQAEVDYEYEQFQFHKKKTRYENSILLKKRKMYDFTVIIPCYNLGHLLEKAIDSVLAQTLEYVEIIVVDDASPEEETIRILKDTEKRVHVVRLKQNSGVSVARNKGIEKAKSPYILCLDADDTIEPTYLEKVKNIFDASNDVGMVSCWAQFFGDSDWLWKPEDHVVIQDALVASPVHTATCFRKYLHEEGGGYDSSLRGYEDWDHWLRIMKQDCSVRVIPEALFNYYVRPGSKVKTSNRNSKELVSGIVNNHRQLYEQYVDYVVAKKHYNWAMCTTRKNQLEEQVKFKAQNVDNNFKNRFWGSVVDFKKKFISKPILKKQE